MLQSCCKPASFEWLWFEPHHNLSVFLSIVSPWVLVCDVILALKIQSVCIIDWWAAWIFCKMFSMPDYRLWSSFLAHTTVLLNLTFTYRLISYTGHMLQYTHIYTCTPWLMNNWHGWLIIIEENITGSHDTMPHETDCKRMTWERTNPCSVNMHVVFVYV